MKIFGLVASLILSFSTFSQKSYYFSDPLPSVDRKVETVDKKWFGKYTSNKDSRSYEINEKGVFIISTSISSMGRASIRESSKYDVHNGYIFGIVEGDSLPCVLDNDRYFFGIRNKDILIGIGSQNILGRVNNNGSQYVVNMYENGNYVPIYLQFERGNLTIKYFEYETDSGIFDFIAEQKSIETEFQELIILTPSEDEYMRLYEKGIYDFPLTLTKGL